MYDNVNIGSDGSNGYWYVMCSVSVMFIDCVVFIPTIRLSLLMLLGVACRKFSGRYGRTSS